MPVIAFTTFLKCLASSTQEKLRQYALYDQPGGYDFYTQLKRNASAVSSGSKRWDSAQAAIDSIAGDAERKHNRSAMTALRHWVERRNATLFDPPEGLARSPNRGLTVRLNPELGVEFKGSRHVVALWATKKPPLSTRVAGVGVKLLQDALAHGEFADCQFNVLDLRANRIYGSKAIGKDTARLLALEFKIAEDLLRKDAAA
jgi:hypothetical protein